MSTGLRFTLEVDGLPPDAFAVVSFHLNQSLSSLFSLDLSLVSQQFLSLEFAQVLDKMAYLTIWQGDEVQRRVKGVVTWFELGENDKNQMLYLLFLNKNLTCVKPWSRLATPVIACHSRTPEVFRLAANHSKQQPSKPCEAELTRALLFTVLSNFLEQSRFIALLMYILRSSVRDSVCRIIQSDIQHYWNLRIVASSLCLSPSLLKKKLKNENTSYSQIVTECRMRYAVQMLLMDNKNITQVAQLCGYSSTSYFISVFKAFYGLTGFAPIFPDTCYHLTHYWPAAADIPV
ncbi:AraC family transcriptional regulator, partial [Escherichia coli]